MLEKKIFQLILNTEGGSAKYKLDKRFNNISENKTYIPRTQTKKNQGIVLTIAKHYRENDISEPYYIKTLTNTDGHIIKKDVYEPVCGCTELLFHSTEIKEKEKGIEYPDIVIGRIGNENTMTKSELLQMIRKIQNENAMLRNEIREMRKRKYTD